MHLLEQRDDQLVFRLDQEEKLWLLQVLRLYPVLGVAFQPLSKSAEPKALRAHQELLHEALLAQREENQRMLHELLSEGRAFSKTEDGWRLTLKREQVESLLQVLNNVRVGSWQKLGCPDAGHEETIGPTSRNVRHVVAMQMSALFEAGLLQAMQV